MYILSLKEAMSIINDYKEKNYEGIILTGGEPTLFKGLEKLLKYAKNIGIHARIITNGQMLSEKKYFENLINAGLDHIHLSIHSYKAGIQGFLTNNNDSLNNIKKLLSYCKNAKITVDINTVINKYNANHLDENVKWLVTNYPFINHYVWNNLDPHMNRVSNNPEVIPKLKDFEISLHKAADYLISQKKSFRIERVPLCYMAEFAEYSTETRKIVKSENRRIHFLDNRGDIEQKDFFYQKAVVCKCCTLNTICAGIYAGNHYYSYDEIYPVFNNKNDIMNRIINC